MSDSFQPHGLHHTRFPRPPPSPGICPNSCPLNQWCYLTVSSWAAPHPCLLLLSSVFPSIRVFSNESALLIWWPEYWSFSFSTHWWNLFIPMNTQGWFSLGLAGLISLQPKGLSRVFSSTTVSKHQFFGTQPSLWSNSHIHTWLLEKS